MDTILPEPAEGLIDRGQASPVLFSLQDSTKEHCGDGYIEESGNDMHSDPLGDPAHWLSIGKAPMMDSRKG